MRRLAIVIACAALLGLAALALWFVAPRDAADSPPGPDQPALGSPDPPVVRTPRPEAAEAPIPAPAEPSVQAPAATLIVHVRAAPTDEAVAGAQVTVSVADGAPLRQATDASGEVRLTGLAPGDVAIRVVAPGHVRGEAATALRADESTTTEIRLIAGVAVVGTVREERTETALSGARVVVTPGGSVGGSVMMRSEGPFGEALTDALGRYRVEGIEPGAIVTVQASAAGHSVATQSVILEPDATEPRQVDLYLAPAGSVRGTVHMQDGEPAAGAQVYVLSADSPALLRVNPTATSVSNGKTYRALSGVADADGSFRVGGLGLDAAYLVFAAVGGGGRSVVQEGVIATAHAPEAKVDLIVLPPPSLLVRVTDPDGRPQETGSLVLFGEGFPVMLEAGDPGEFGAGAATPGHYKLQITCPGAVIQELSVDIVAGKLHELDVRLDRGLSLTGVLVDDEDTPIAGQTIVIDRHWTDAGKYPPSAARTTTDDEGGFHVTGLCAGPHGLILVQGRHDVPDALRLEPSADEVRITVNRRASLRARLRLPGASVSPESVAVRISRKEGNGVSDSAVSSQWADGALVVENLPVETFRITIRVPGYLAITRDVQVAPGETLDLGPIDVEPGFDLSGRVLDRAGAPVAGAQVSTGMIWTSEHQVVATDRDGRFTLRGIASRTASIEIEAEGFVARSAGVDLPWSGAEWAVTLDVGSLLTLHLADAAGKPAAGVYVRVTAVLGAGADGEAYTDALATDHRGVLGTRLPAGKWLLEVVDAEWETILSREVTLVEGGNEEIGYRVR